jgi:hypothetical protein
MRLASLVPSSIRKRRWEHKTTAQYAAGLLAGHEPEAALLPTLCDRARVWVDVGANLGGYTLLLRKLSARVIAYEPNPDLAARLNRVFRLSRSVEVRRCALSDISGAAMLRVPPITAAARSRQPTTSAAGRLLRSVSRRGGSTRSRSAMWDSLKSTWKVTNWQCCGARREFYAGAGLPCSSRPTRNTGPAP